MKGKILSQDMNIYYHINVENELSRCFHIAIYAH